MLDRRRFLIQSGQWLGLLGLSSISRVHAAPKFQKNPFALGIASGDPAADGFVLWTRVAPEPLAGGGVDETAFEVEWILAEDEKLSKEVRKGTALADAKLAHSVHVELEGLKPDRWYYYQFRLGSWETTVGRAKTAPLPSDRLRQLRFAFASCQHYEAGLYTAYAEMAEEDLDLVVHLGDYIYEGAAGQGVRKHNSAEIVTLNDYRNRYQLYKSDAHLQRVHALFPWIVTWDDHEVDNDYAGDSPEDNQTRNVFLERRASAYQAYYEHQPLRRSLMPQGSSMRLYRRVPYGQLAQFHVLDTRQYRRNQPCGGARSALCPGARDPKQTILGADQEKWLTEGLADSAARWNVLANQVPIGPIDLKPGAGESFAMDKWNGYVVERARLMEFLYQRKVSNPIVITGDVHSHWAMDLKRDPEDFESATVGSEFVGTSISSGGDGVDIPDAVQGLLPDNPHVKFFNAQRGYVRCKLDQDRWQTDYRVIPFVTRAGAKVATRAKFVVESGKAGLQRG